jgi:hypothetical protein
MANGGGKVYEPMKRGGDSLINMKVDGILKRPSQTSVTAPIPKPPLKKSTSTPVSAVSRTGMSSKPTSRPPVTYAQYPKDSKQASGFRSAFSAARKAGKKSFTWEGRKYTTDKK